MNSYLFGFILPLSGIAILIFLLSMIQYGINSDIAKNTNEADTQDSSTHEQNGNINQARSPPVADAIHAYRRYRQADEGARAKRERVTIIVLTGTAIFAFLAAVAAGVSAWIFQGQLSEMRDERRPWISIINLHAVDDFDWKINNLSLIVSYDFKNVGLTPTLNVTAYGRVIFNPFVFNRIDTRPPDVNHELDVECNNALRTVQHPERFPSGRFFSGNTIFPSTPSPVGRWEISATADEFERRGIRRDDSVIPYIILCVVYTDPDKNDHATGIVYTIFARNTFVLPLGQMPVPATEINIEQNFMYPGLIK